ncbi:MAG: caspase family protein [Cyanobacteria bacterium P01_H01_bin.35]
MVSLKKLKNFINFRVITGTLTTALMILGISWYFAEGTYPSAIAAISGITSFLGLFQYSFLSFDKNIVADRVALIVGNQNYINTPPLVNSINDAEAICEALKKVGFKIIKRIDPSTNELKKAINDFQTILSTGGVGLFYYTGHASQINEHNYILPVDVNLTDREEFVKKAIDLNVLLSPIDKIIEDTPRHNGSIIIYSTASGNVAYDFFQKPSESEDGKNNSGEKLGQDNNNTSIKNKSKANRHSPFAQAFLSLIDKWNVEIFDFFRELLPKVRDSTDYRQIPWIAASVDTEFYFKPIVREDIGTLKILIFDACRNDPFYRPPIYYALSPSNEVQQASLEKTE